MFLSISDVISRRMQILQSQKMVGKILNPHWNRWFQLECRSKQGIDHGKKPLDRQRAFRCGANGDSNKAVNVLPWNGNEYGVFFSQRFPCLNLNKGLQPDIFN